MKYFLNFLLLLVILTPCSAQKFMPSLNLAKGSSYNLNSNATSEIVQSVNGQENKVNLSVSFGMTFKVVAITDAAYNLEASYQSLDMSLHIASQTLEFDSKKNDPLDTPSSIIASLMNKPFNIILSKSGRVKSVENIEKMIAAAFNSFPGIDSAKKARIKSQFLQSFGANSFTSSLEMGTAIFPGKPVSKNDTWTINTGTEVPYKAGIQTTYELIDATGDVYQIHGDGVLVSDKDAKALEVNGLPMKYELNGTTLTDIKINKATGWITEIKVRQLMSGNIQILDNPKIPGGMTIPMTFNTQITTTGK